MSDDRQLSQKLAALTEELTFEDGAMKIGVGGSSDAVADVLRVIDTTVLSRDLTIRIGDRTVVLGVGGRRVKVLLDASTDLSPDTALIGKTLQKDEIADIVELGALLSRLTAHSGSLLARRDPATRVMAQTDMGVSVAQMSELWQVDPFAERLTGMAKFLSVLGSASLATAQVAASGQAEGFKGDTVLHKAMNAALDARVRPALASQNSKYSKEQAHRLLSFSGALKEGAVLSSVELEGHHILVATAADSWPKLAAAWAASAP